MTTTPRENDGGFPVRRLLVGTGALSIALSAAFALGRGREPFLTDSYTFYVEMAQTFLDGGGLCFAPGEGCAIRGPVYPLIVVLFLKLDVLYPGLSLLQAGLAGLLPPIVYGIGVRVVSRPAALLAAGMTAVNPYGVIHGTALQETGVFNVLAALAVLLLLQSAASARHGWAVAAGLATAAATLTAVRFALFIPCAVAWLAVQRGDSGRAFHRASMMALPIVLVVGGWALRNVLTVGAPVLTTQAGMSFWVGNNATTLAFIPGQSIDGNITYSFDHLPPERAALLASADEVAADRLLARWGWQEFSADPVLGFLNMVRKVGHAFSGQLSPARSAFTQLAFALVYVPIHVLAAVGLWQSRAGRGPQALIYLLLGSFAMTTALFWAHTSHASYLHPVLFLYASAALVRGIRARPTHAQRAP